MLLLLTMLNLKKKRVLVFDDDQDVLYTVTFVLTNIGWEVFTSLDCKNIIEKVLKISPSVILMDINFPEENPQKAALLLKPYFAKNGIEVIRLLKAYPITKDIPVVLFSSDVNISSLAKQAGIKLFLRKPFGIDKLESIISQAYHKYQSIAK